jgi:hypothetical protein
MSDTLLNGVSVSYEHVATSFSPINKSSLLHAQEHVTNNNEQIQNGTPDQSSDDVDDLFDEDRDSDSEYGEIIAPSQKKRRRTNNSFAADLENGERDIEIPPPAKRFQFNTTDRGVLIGVWKNSPAAIDAQKHAVYAFLDSKSSLRQKVHPETQDGQEFTKGFPTGTGKAFVIPAHVLLDPHLSSLTPRELKEYVRFRSASYGKAESPEQRDKANTLAVAEAKKATAEEIVTKSPATPQPRLISTVSSQAPTKVSRPDIPFADIRGALLGFWKDSDAAKDFDKHAAYGVVNIAVNGKRMRVKILKFTRDGRPYIGNYPTKAGENWRPFEDVVLEPGLSHLNRFEVIEYASLREEERQSLEPGLSGAEVNMKTVEKAKAIFAAKANAEGMDPSEYCAKYATREADRKAKNALHSSQRKAGLPAVEGVEHSPTTRAGDKSTGNGTTPPSFAPPHLRWYKTHSIRNNSGEDRVRVEPIIQRGLLLNDNQFKSYRAEVLSLLTEGKVSQLTCQTDIVGVVRSFLVGCSTKFDFSAIPNDWALEATTLLLLYCLVDLPVGNTASRAPELESKDGKQPEVIATTPKTDIPAGKAKAVRSSKAESDARAEKLKRLRESGTREKVMPAAKAESHKLAGSTYQEEPQKRQAAEEKDWKRTKEQESQPMTISPGVQLRKEQDAKDREVARKKEISRARREAEQASARGTELAKKQQLGVVAKETGEWNKGDQIKERTFANIWKNFDRMDIDNVPSSATSKSINEEAVHTDSRKAGSIKSNVPVVDDGIREARHPPLNSSEPTTATSTPQPVSDVKWHCGMKYERKDNGPFPGRWVGAKKEVLTMDGEDYVEYRILKKLES